MIGLPETFHIIDVMLKRYHDGPHSRKRDERGTSFWIHKMEQILTYTGQKCAPWRTEAKSETPATELEDTTSKRVT
jgi:hypothetical protein